MIIDRVQVVAKLAFALAPGNVQMIAGLVREFVPSPLPAEVAYEIVLQSYLFFGYPQAIEAAKTFRAALVQHGHHFPESNFDYDNVTLLRNRGEELCRKIYHPNYDQLIANMKLVSPEIAEWMVTEGYGKVLSRRGPTGIEREIASIVFLACSGHPVQLYSHLRGARNLGAARDQIMDAVTDSGLSGQRLAVIRVTAERVFSA